MFQKILFAVLSLSFVCAGQVAGHQPKVAVLGKSIAMFEVGLQQEIFPTYRRMSTSSVILPIHSP